MIYLFNGQIPWFYKLTLLLPVIWNSTPIGEVAVLLPIVNIIDEFGVLFLTMWLFTSLCQNFLQRKVRRTYASEAGQHTATYYTQAAAKPPEIVEGEYYVIDPTQKEAPQYRKAS